jgi:hypothetical protein
MNDFYCTICRVVVTDVEAVAKRERVPNEQLDNGFFILYHRNRRDAALLAGALPFRLVTSVML